MIMNVIIIAGIQEGIIDETKSKTAMERDF